MGVVPRKPTGARCSEKVHRCLQSPLAGAHSYARKAGAHPEGLLPGGHNTPPEGRMPPPGGFPTNLASINLTGWARLIQDVAQGMKMVPLNLSMDGYLDSMMLLQLLEATTGMGYCRICCQPTPSCLCARAYGSAPSQAWSQVMANIPAPGVVVSSAGSTTSEASTAEIQEPGVTSPPPGLTPQDFSNWSLPLQGALQTGGLPLPSGGGVDRPAEGPRARRHNPRLRALLRERS